jgi:hypothetical protein
LQIRVGDRRRWTALLGIVVWLGPAAPAAGDGAPRVTIERAATAPELDGRLDDPAWEGAALLGPLRQVEPREGAAPSEPTEVRLFHDGRFLYVGVRCFDREPGAIVANELQRDRELDDDDRFAIVLDTFGDQRTAFLFEVNPNGVKRDALVEQNQIVIPEWNGIWIAKARVHERGWTAELAIPFTTLSFDPGRTEWGLNVERNIRRRDEILRWATPAQNRDLVDVSGAGVLSGMTGLEQRLGLDVRPIFAIRHEDDVEDGDRSTLLEPGLDVFYRPTPSLTGSLTVNPDFSDAPADPRRVNLTRFDLFFEETRDFFLEDAGVFEFGNLEENGRPFFSRRIGLDGDDEPVPIRVGAKLAGRHGPLKIGLLDAQVASSGDVENKNLSVARVAVDVLEQSSLGMIVTHGDPRSNASNTLAGLDLRYRNDHVFGDQVVTGDAWVQKSFGSGDGPGGRGLEGGQEWAFGGLLRYPNDRVEAELGFSEFGRDFDPGLGFVNRRGIRDYLVQTRYRVRPDGWLRTVDTGFKFTFVTDLSNEIESGSLGFDWIEFRTQPRDKLAVQTFLRRERLVEPFEIEDGVFIAPGTYDFDRHRVSFETSQSRPVSVALEIECCDFYSGRRLTILPTLELRPSKHVFLLLQYEEERVRLPGGDFDARLGRIQLDLRFNVEIFWTTLVQYDNLSKRLGAQSRLRWIVAPERELHLVVEHGMDHRDGRPLRTNLSRITTKVQWNFRF